MLCHCNCWCSCPAWSRVRKGVNVISKDKRNQRFDAHSELQYLHEFLQAQSYRVADSRRVAFVDYHTLHLHNITVSDRLMYVTYVMPVPVTRAQQLLLTMTKQWTYTMRKCWIQLAQ